MNEINELTPTEEMEALLKKRKKLIRKQDELTASIDKDLTSVSKQVSNLDIDIQELASKYKSTYWENGSKTASFDSGKLQWTGTTEVLNEDEEKVTEKNTDLLSFGKKKGCRDLIRVSLNMRNLIPIIELGKLPKGFNWSLRKVNKLKIETKPDA